MTLLRRKCANPYNDENVLVNFLLGLKFDDFYDDTLII